MFAEGARPHEVDITEHLWIPMPDGVRLAARMWLPKGALDRPVPAIFEYIPYRKSDIVRARDERNHPYFAEHGYACLRVDMRGSGDSEGQMDDMYSDYELSDAHAVIRWLSRQPWCSGKVGMFGTSWGGTAALQANLAAPEALQAVIAVCATHDRYEDDIHHKGGCLLTDTFEWGATLPAILAAPPTPASGADWKDRWSARLEQLAFPVEAWVREEARGQYWRHGSVIHNANRLARPILAVGGWSDRYSNSVMSLVSARPDLVWGVVGPWGHHYPDQGHPGPAMGFQQLALDWWDRWLKGSGRQPVEPKLRVWLREFDEPSDVIHHRTGRWIETGVPEAHCEPLNLTLTEEGLRPSAGSRGAWPVPGDMRVGAASGDTGYFGRYGGQPLEQSGDDARALTFETAPLDADIVLYGAATLQLELRSSHPRAQLSIRLCDVAPDGRSARVGLCMRNLALNDLLDEPDQPAATAQSVAVPFHTKAYRFRQGHRMRLSIASSYWPLVWPAPGLSDLVITCGTLRLPVFQGTPQDLKTPLPEPLALPRVSTHETVAAPALRRQPAQLRDGRWISGWHQPFTEVFCTETGTSFGYETQAEFRMTGQDPLSAECEVTHRSVFKRPDGTAEIASILTAACDQNVYIIDGKITARWDGAVIAEHLWDYAIPRRFS